MVSINAACSRLAETTAAYRYFINIKVTPEKILEPYWAATFEQVIWQPVVILF